MSKIMELVVAHETLVNLNAPRDTLANRAAIKAEVERMEAEIDALKTVELRAKDWHKVANDRAAEIVRLHEVIDALRVDAERYRFWRNRYPKTFEPTEITPEDVDRLTDVAIQAEGTNHD